MDRSVVIVVCHPDETSLTHAVAANVIAQVTSDGLTCTVQDLYRDGYDPVLAKEDLRRKGAFDPLTVRYGHELERSAGVVIVHPDWWGMPPALLKGWMDKVLCRGVAYDWEERGNGSLPLPLLSHLWGVVAITTDAPDAAPLTPLRTIWEEHVAGFCGICPVRTEVLAGVRTSTHAQRVLFMNHVANVVTTLHENTTKGGSCGTA